MQSHPTKSWWVIAFVAVVLLLGLSAWLAIEPDLAGPQEPGKVTARQQVPQDHATKPKLQVVTRFLRTELIDLKIEEFNITDLVSDFAVNKGAIERVNTTILIAEGAGRLVELKKQAGGPVSGRILSPRVKTNASAMHEYYGSREPSANLNMVRITDLLLLKDGKSLAVAHGLWDVDSHCVTLNVKVILLDDLLVRDGQPKDPWRPLFQSRPCLTLGWPDANVLGGRLEQLDDSRILLSIGSAWQDQPDNPVLKEGDYGSIIQINLADGSYRSISRGHRNSQGLEIDSVNRIWETEHGPQGGDELNLIKPGANYGWPHVTYGTGYGSREWKFSKRQGHHDLFEKPVFAWLPSIGISNLIELKGFNERWDGDMLITSLRARSLHRLRLEGDRVIYEERIRMHQRIRDIISVEDGTLVVWTDKGNLLWVSGVDPDRTIEDRIAGVSPDLQAALGRCAKCHGFDAGSADRGKISLFKIFGSKPARGPEHLYTEEMKRFAAGRGRWNGKLLDSFIASPETVVPGTSMAGEGEPDARVRKAIVSFLKTLY